MSASSRARAVLLALAAALSCTCALAADMSGTSTFASSRDRAPERDRSATATVAGAPTGCHDTCATPFGPPQRSIVRRAGGCAVRITWIARPSCDVGWDLVVLRVEPLNDACGGVTIGRLVDEATDSLIAGRETGLFTMAGFRDSCVVIGRILRSACWGYRVECGDTLVVPCDTISCCESAVLLCTDSIFRRKFVRGASVLRAPCSPRDACVPVCGARRDTTVHRNPNDSVSTDPDDIGTLSSGGPRDIEPESRTAARGMRHRSWQWRDPRPVRTPMRELRDEDWLLARDDAETTPRRRP